MASYFIRGSSAEFTYTDADDVSDVPLSTITMSRMGTLIAPANPMIVSTNASIISPPCCKRSGLTAGKIGPLGVHRTDTLFVQTGRYVHIERGAASH